MRCCDARDHAMRLVLLWLIEDVDHEALLHHGDGGEFRDEVHPQANKGVLVVDNCGILRVIVNKHLCATSADSQINLTRLIKLISLVHYFDLTRLNQTSIFSNYNKAHIESIFTQIFDQPDEPVEDSVIGQVLVTGSVRGRPGDGRREGFPRGIEARAWVDNAAGQINP